MNENNIELADDIIVEQGQIDPSENTPLKTEEKEYNKNKDKQRLIDILERIKRKMEQKDKNEIKDVFLGYKKEQSFEEKKVRRNRSGCCCKLCYKISLLIITSIYLVGLFLIASLKNSVWNLFVTAIKCKFEIACDKDEFIKQSNFFENFIDKLIKEPIDLNLIMFWNFIGIHLSNSIGFSITSLIFLIINSLILLYTFNIDYMEYQPEECKYSYPKIISIFLNWVLMAISFGGSSLLAQQNLIDFYSLLDDVEEKEDESTELKEIAIYDVNSDLGKQRMVYNDDSDKKGIFEKYGIEINDEKNDDDEFIGEEKSNLQMDDQEKRDEIKKRNFNSLLIFGLSNIFGYAGKYGICLGIAYYKQNNYSLKTEFNNTTFSLNIIINNYSFHRNNSIIFNNNETSIITNDYEFHKNIFLFIGLIYISCILVSTFLLFQILLLFFFEKTNKNNKDNEDIDEENEEAVNENEKAEQKLRERLNGCCLWRNTCEICGCVIYSERLILDKNSHSKGCCRLFCESVNNFCNNAICNMCNCRRVSKNNEKNLCCCCYRYQEIHFEKNRQCFCYCYQEKGFCDYINKFIINETQREIIFCMILYLLSKLATICCKRDMKIFYKIMMFLKNGLYLLLVWHQAFFSLV